MSSSRDHYSCIRPRHPTLQETVAFLKEKLGDPNQEKILVWSRFVTHYEGFGSYPPPPGFVVPFPRAIPRVNLIFEKLPPREGAPRDIWNRDKVYFWLEHAVPEEGYEVCGGTLMLECFHSDVTPADIRLVRAKHAGKSIEIKPVGSDFPDQFFVCLHRMHSRKFVLEVVWDFVSLVLRKNCFPLPPAATTDSEQ